MLDWDKFPSIAAIPTRIRPINVRINLTLGVIIS